MNVYEYTPRASVTVIVTRARWLLAKAKANEFMRATDTLPACGVKQL